MNFQPHITMRRAARSRAFTMVEIALALAVIGFALVAIIGVLPIGLSVQKDNREETLVNFDANYLMNAIRTGAQGQDDLTNYIICITNYLASYKFDPVNGTNLDPNNPPTYQFFTRSSCGVSNQAPVNFSILTNGSNIIGLLSTPKYEHITYNLNANGVPDPLSGTFDSNYTTADFRSISGAAAVQGTNSAAWDFAFSYRVVPEIIYDGWNMSYSPAWVNPTNSANTAAWNISRNLQGNLIQVRLRFYWPVLPATGGTGPGRRTCRATVFGSVVDKEFPWPAPVPNQFGDYFIQPQTSTNVGQTL
jgi:type II secretory pathway pseudopilin PulG